MTQEPPIEATQESPQDSTKQQFQIYDSSLKTWISQQAATILPVLLPGTSYEATLDVELVPPAMRVDKVFKVLYHGEEHVLDTELYRDDKETLHQQYTCFQVLLSRTRTITRAEKDKIKERLHMFQELFDESPIIQEIRKVSHDQGLEEGIQQGIQNFQILLVNAVQDKYPDLAEFARQRASHFRNLEKLNQIILQVMHAPDANTLLGILEADTEA